MLDRHYVIPMDDSRVQRCIFCDQVVMDNRFTVTPEPGLQEGWVYQSDMEIFTELPAGETFRSCDELWQQEQTSMNH